MAAPIDYQALRQEMVERQLKARGIRSGPVLQAMGKVRREGYVPSYLGEFAYDDTPLPIEEEQTISQPYIVAAMLEALDLGGGEKVLEIGTGSGYAAAVLAEIAGEVYTIERHATLARSAAERLARDGYRNVHVRCGDGTLGWPEAAPFDAIVVAAGGPEVPESLREQLAIGGRMVIPVGRTIGLQRLLRITRTGPDRYETEDLGAVRFVPLVGAEGWRDESPAERPPRELSLAQSIRVGAEAFDSIATANLDGLLERIGDARVVLLGEATHGTAEFYAMRARITESLIERKGFKLVAVEADWPDAARIDHYVRDLDVPPADWRAFARFPTWMWRNAEVAAFTDRLRQYNAQLPPEQRVRFAGLDLYSLYTSIDAVLNFLDRHDPEAARIARERYACLTPWQSDPAAYGQAAITGRYRSCEQEVVRMLEDLLARRMDLVQRSPEGFFDAVQNARVVADAEQYYRVMYYGGPASWNLRDTHMFGVLKSLMKFHGADSRAVVWAHNSHIGDASTTEMAARGELNIGELCRQEWGAAAYAIGFGTDSGTVAAASAWDGPMEIKQLRPAHEQSYEYLCHESGEPQFLLPLRHADRRLQDRLMAPRLERAIGVIYRPETELASHYFHAVLPRQFDEYVWFDQSSAVQPLPAEQLAGMPDTWPFGL
ncbi:MAG: protein-L-isoaspartate(D-aspartate) O-methyltransferase [Gammaproteobacteria bacterium]|nr:MAG: protein-L-isoaspartate(D-aspartate) O-methyltransferase [Gammaproteobacteria bacterium]